jgi:hypothetical protein
MLSDTFGGGDAPEDAHHLRAIREQALLASMTLR